jgi:hypothetical protein
MRDETDEREKVRGREESKEMRETGWRLKKTRMEFSGLY